MVIEIVLPYRRWWNIHSDMSNPQTLPGWFTSESIVTLSYSIVVITKSPMMGTPHVQIQQKTARFTVQRPVIHRAMRRKVLVFLGRSKGVRFTGMKPLVKCKAPENPQIHRHYRFGIVWGRFFLHIWAFKSESIGIHKVRSKEDGLRNPYCSPSYFWHFSVGKRQTVGHVVSTFQIANQDASYNFIQSFILIHRWWNFI